MNAPNPSNTTTPDAQLERTRLWLRLLKITRGIEAELRENLRQEFNTTLPRFDVMAALDRADHGLKMSELSRHLMVSNGNVTGIVDRLVQDQMMIREAVPGDRRAARVSLTKKGRAEFALQAAAHQTWLDDLLGDLRPQDAAALTQMLQPVQPRTTKES